jgi:transcription elongation factor GreA
MADLPDELQNRPQRKPGQEPTATLTLDAYLRIKAELEELTTTGREQITENEQGLMESKIRKLQQMLRDPEIVEAPAHADEVGSGMLVTIRPLDEDDPDDETYLLAEHAEEKAPGARTVTTTSPLGTALIGAAVGQEVVYEAPGGNFRYEVVSFEPHTG